MSEGKASEVHCRKCNKKVPLGNYCIHCATKIDTESTDGGLNDEPRPPIPRPIQTSDASAELGTQFPSQQNSDTSNLLSNRVPISDNPSFHDESNKDSKVSNSSSYANAVKSTQQNPQQNQHPNCNVTRETVTNGHGGHSQGEHNHRNIGSLAGNENGDGATTRSHDGPPRKTENLNEGNNLQKVS